MRKTISVLMIVLMLLTTLFGCKDKNGNGNGNRIDNVKFNLQSGVDYIDHSTTASSDGMEYDESMWYVNELKDVPLPDPQVFVEDDVYYIVGTSDRGPTVNTVAWLTATLLRIL